MVLEDFLLPNENVRYRESVRSFIINGKRYDDLIITDNRLIFYKREGMIFKKDNLETMGLNEIKGLKFREKGIISKKGTIEVHGPIKWTIEGNLNSARTFYQALSEKLGKS